MEPIKNKSGKILESESHFAYLLNEQNKQVSESESFLKKFKIISITFVAVIIIFTLFTVFRVFLQNSNDSTLNKSEKSVRQTGVFIPTNNKIEGTIQGKISKVFSHDIENTNNQQEYELLGKDNKRIAYIYSQKNDLSLMLDVEVEIEGELRRRSEDGFDVILVKSLVVKR